VSLAIPCFGKWYNTVTGGGARERVFWQNYFFHCAFTRYEAGLSIDEIWSYQKLGSADEVGGPVDGTISTESPSNAGKASEEETVIFDAGSGLSDPTDSGPKDAAFQNDDMLAPSTAAGGTTDSSLAGQTEGAQSTNGFELVDGEENDDGVVGDPELDELEAEIARELEDM
jgi:hypothetical protein